ncbi:chromosome segregation protein SMC [Bifidobacterium pullorum subsp. saeculare]|uniref:chromosome segregation protein SMC n=1 Tax=Bifidobacterium pullorum TaxID=78448 RepID=UPI0019564ADE|nr:chromosome segregation protein SMC [Bifidobacterium pullorum]MBM6696741.1 chromosome segregation protein SMC [Bifidobacterium pullorum subsp. saeculare]
MYLKELTLRGFKSFASATTLRFEPGITAVVGPNGSGKSNIVDALTWVMGEQGAKNLRGSSMEDVIFAGTSSRPPLGRAQVSLTIDNIDRTLDIDYTEVTISRTIWRNGGSEYAINGSPCRLLDIQELLSDTGLGQQMHVIVGQGRLDAILKADPSGHRAFIEEAAGILKHRKRKERALRKLANTETNLSRLDDLLGEIRRQLGPLGRQARISRRADSIQISLRDAQARLYAEDACESMKRREALRTELTAVRTQLNAAQHDLARIKVRIEQVEALSSQSSPAMARINQTFHELSRIEERLHALSQLAGERSRSLAGQIVTNFGEDPGILEQRAAELDAQAQEQQRTVSDMRLAFDKATERRADGEKRLASVRQTLNELRRTTQQRETQIANLRELVVREESAVQLTETRIRDFSGQRETLIRQHDEAEQQRQTLERESQAVDDDGGAALETARETVSRLQDELNAVEARRREVDGRIISLQAKADALRDTLDSRNASGSLERDASLETMGRLTDFIRVAEGWEEGVAHALEQFAGAMVVPGREQMLHALKKAKADKLGKAVILTAAPVRTSAAAGRPASEASADSRSVTALATLVGPNPDAPDPAQASDVADTVRVLLSDVAAVDDVAQAQRVTSGTTGFTRAVTRDGEVVVAGVAAIGGSSLSQSDLSLASRRDKALHEVAELKAELADLETQVAQARDVRDQARLAVDAAAQRRTELRLRIQQAEKALRGAVDRVASLSRQVTAMDERIAKTREDAQSHRLKLDDLNRALASAQTSTGKHADFDDLTDRERELEQSLNAAREQEVSARIAWTEANRKAESLTRQAGLLHDNAREAAERRTRLEALNERRRRQMARIERIASDADAVAGLVAASIRNVVARREELQAAVSSHDEELKTLRAQRNEIEPRVAGLQRREHELDVDRERLAAAYGQLMQKVADAVGMGLDELVAQYGPDQPVPVLDDDGRPVPLDDGDDAARSDGSGDAAADGPADGDAAAPVAYRTVPYVRAEQVRRLEKAKRDLAALGKVNPLAAEEYEALEARNRYLNDQRNDVVNSRDDLMTLIHDLDKTMVEVFRSAFEDTAAAFEQVFATLFPGGTGRLRLENPDDLLTTGVLVEASPAGKRVKQLSLLSGGERSLTALALLFAIFTARPSPFYVMDEVEAALDDVNLTRLLNAFEQLRSHAQLIVITHQQRTMSIADALYGVTMRADGVTAVVSQKLKRAG